MFTRASYDPVVFDRIRREHPRLHPNHIDLVRIAHHEELAELADLDAELENLTARRRQICRRVEAYRERLWAAPARRFHRPGRRPGQVPMPPAPADAEPLGGADLRRVAVAILRRHGALELRELHGLLHRYGYDLWGQRPVQRLADALAYEARHGRLERVSRGVYGVTVHGAASLDRERNRELRSGRPVVPDLADPLPWSEPTAEVWDDPPPIDVPIDVPIADDPERWSDGRWPASAQLGADFCAGPPDRDIALLASDLDATVEAIRHRLADLVAEREGPAPTAPGRRRRASAKAPTADDLADLEDVESRFVDDEFVDDEFLESEIDGAQPDDDYAEEASAAEPSTPGHDATRHDDPDPNPTDPDATDPDLNDARPDDPADNTFGNDSSTNRSQRGGNKGGGAEGGRGGDRPDGAGPGGDAPTGHDPGAGGPAEDGPA